MIEETGRVVAVEPDAVWVETLRRSACESCTARNGCGHKLLDSERAGSRARLRVLNPDMVLCTGDQIVLGIPEGALVRGALMIYLMPLLLLFAGALLGSQLSLNQTDLSAPLGVAGLAVGFLINRWYSQSRAADPRLQPHIMRRLCPDPAAKMASPAEY